MKILCHGDSLTEGSDIEKAYTWTSLVEHNLKVPVLNKGIGGDSTAGMLSRLSCEVIPQQPAIVILMGGTNDLWWNLELNLIQSNLRAMVSQVRYHGITPVLGLPLPIWIEKAKAQEWGAPLKGYVHLSAQIDKLAQSLKSHADQWEVPVLDFHNMFLNDEGIVNKSLFLEDGVHPSQVGHRVMGIYAAKFLKDVFHFA